MLCADESLPAVLLAFQICLYNIFLFVPLRRSWRSVFALILPGEIAFCRHVSRFNFTRRTSGMYVVFSEQHPVSLQNGAQASCRIFAVVIADATCGICHAKGSQFAFASFRIRFPILTASSLSPMNQPPPGSSFSFGPCQLFSGFSVLRWIVVRPIKQQMEENRLQYIY